MLNEKENESETNPQNFDARVVHTVRNLKKLPSRHSNDNLPSQDPAASDILHHRQSLNSPNETIARSLNDLGVFKSQKEYNKKRISIDGSGHSTSDSSKQEPTYKESNTLNSKKLVKKFNTLSKPTVTGSKPINFSSNNVVTSMMRTKSEFQKRLMNEQSINKYKSMCMSILKDEEEIRKLCESAGLITTSSSSTSLTSKENLNLEKFLEENFFNDHYFIYKLESLLELDVSKAKKEKFFREEIQNFLGLKILDLQYEDKLKSLNIALDIHLKNIENFNFFN